MSESEKTVQEMLLELTQNHRQIPSPNTYIQRGTLLSCDSLVLSDPRMMNNFFQHILNIPVVNKDTLNHIKTYSGSDKIGLKYCSITIDSINRHLIYSLISTRPIELGFIDYLINLLRPENRSAKSLEF